MKDNFDYFDYENPQKYFEKIRNLELLLGDKGFPVFLYGGTLLGSIREKDLLKCDDDFDLFYISKKLHRKAVLNEFEEVIRPLLEKDGWEIEPIRWILNGEKLMMGQYHIIKDNISMDIWTAWFDKNDKFNVTMTIEDTHIMKSDILPIKDCFIRDKVFNAPNNFELFLEHLYGKDWRIPDSNYKIPANKNFIQKTILKVIDQFGWAYYFIAKDQQKYSYQNINYKCIKDMREYDIIEDVIYFHSPGMAKKEIDTIIDRVDRKKTKIIGAYGGETELNYKDADLIVTISFPFLEKLKLKYPDKPCIFLPEAIDTNYFNTKRKKRKKFQVGYVGRPCKVKRMHLLDELDYEIKTHTEWGQKYFVEGRTLDDVKDFYKSIDCLVLTSQSECMPRVVLEAMAMGLPVISTDVGCLRMLLEPEWIVPNSSEEDIVKNINDRLHILKKYPTIRQEVGKRNRKHIEEHFSWEKIQQKWDAVCNALVVNDYDKILEIGKEFEDKWSSLYEKFDRKVRTDLIRQPIQERKISEIYNKQNNSIEKYITERLEGAVLLSTSCLQIINNGCLSGNKHYIGVRENELITTRLILINDGWIPNEDDLFGKDGISIQLQVYSGETKRHGCGIYVFDVPFPVVFYLNNTIGEDWKNE